MRAQDTHVVLHRPLGDRWRSVAFTTSHEKAIARLLKHGKKASAGDLLLALEIECVSDIGRHAKDLYFVNQLDAMKKAPPSYDSWLAIWEGPEAKADNMLAWARGLPIHILVEIVLSMAERTRPYSTNTAKMLALTKRWLDGDVSLSDINRAIANERQRTTEINTNSQRCQESMAMNCMRTITCGRNADHAIEDVSGFLYHKTGERNSSNMTLLAYDIRQIVPIHIFLDSLCAML